MPDQKEVTIYDIARYLNLSATTVSRGLKDHPTINKQTRKKIAEAAQLLGYRSNTFASSLRSKRSNTIGVIVPRLNSQFMSGVLAAMEDTASREGYNLLITQSLEKEDKEKMNANTMFNKRVDGLLISLAYDTKSIGHLQPFLDKKIPVVFFDRTWDQSQCTSVMIDNYKAAYEATKHLLDQGRRRILHLGGSKERNVYADRLRGYRHALRDSGIAYDEKLVRISQLLESSGTEAAAWILKQKPAQRPDAVFGASDTVAAHCMLALLEAGIRIPDDIAIAGFNNDPISRIVSPALTTVDYPGYHLGDTAMKSLLEQLNGLPGAGNTNSIILKSELIIRASSQKKTSL
ncbi:LacI family DNA-binding transcriptional regulator [Pseudobacter ginsenosidimutans]|jgi:LacI family transcriptional regulator|uniref:LacI family transcriptional regulator n=1 Tax=Pseudobacter ginsenosidimutans TaxID=661488 RepID=A0A4Q7MUU7_9BACT|nr:LacI family DNA-binding transcriptional regulator [Pseudobacter ginsenosidimutans]QEC40601.1 LacI family transcriptional regulator [Pseudobacter ginsenosidimutans]RZS72682.1 LacI family transcriptional regulator [Pseudobacter ginsenosidimutans]